MKILLSLFALVLSIFMISCAQLGDIPRPDTPPPAGYDPVFAVKAKEMTTIPGKPMFSLSRVEAKAAQGVVLSLHILDSNLTLLTGADKPKWSKIWCEVIDSTAAGEKKIADYKLREVFPEQSSPVSMAIVMDHSGSMGDDRARAVQQAMVKLIGEKDDKHKFSLVRYDERVIVESPLTNDKSMLTSKNPVDALSRYGGFTATLDGIMRGIELVANTPPNERRAVVVFTDGDDNSSNFKTDEVIQKAKENNVLVCGVDYGYYTRPGMLEEISRKTNGIYHHIYLTNEFDHLFKDLYTRLNHYYEMTIDPDTYGYHKIKLKLCLGDTALYQEVVLDNTPEPGAITLLNVYFDTAKWNLKKESESAVRKLHQLMTLYPGMKIELHGHTDNAGKPDANLALSQKRADAIKEELVKKGIDGGRIATFGHGDRKPVSDNSTPDGMARNRRTEFIVKSM